MVMVLISGAGKKFHSTRDCWQLTKTPHVGDHREVDEIDLEDIAYPLPCRTCYPDAPRLESVHRYCRVCDTGKVNPCEHNGGVKVMMTQQHRSQTITSEAGDTFTRWIHVWPERVHLYV